jgi:aldehyde dehydrogenase (NAD+)
MDVDKLSFTGSVRTARALLKASAESNLKRISLELGGKNPNIIFPDCFASRVSREAALRSALWGIFANKGEVCSGGLACCFTVRYTTNFLMLLWKGLRP